MTSKTETILFATTIWLLGVMTGLFASIGIIAVTS